MSKGVPNEKICHIGEFVIYSGRFIISDPCIPKQDGYTPCEHDAFSSMNKHMEFLEESMHGILNNIKHGEWQAFVVKNIYGFQMSNTELAVLHNSLVHRHQETYEKIHHGFTHTAPFHINVTSAQVGIFDEKYYRDDSMYYEESLLVKKLQCGDSSFCNYPGSRWYGHCCEATSDPRHFAGIVPFGAVCGINEQLQSQKCVCMYNVDDNNEIEAVKIKFEKE